MYTFGDTGKKVSKARSLMGEAIDPDEEETQGFTKDGVKNVRSLLQLDFTASSLISFV